MGPTAAVRLLEVEPELAEFLNSEEIAEARQIVLPTLEIPNAVVVETEMELPKDL